MFNKWLKETLVSLTMVIILALLGGGVFSQTNERYFSLRKEGKHHDAFVGLRKGLTEGNHNLLLSQTSSLVPDPKEEKIFAKFVQHMKKSDTLKAAGNKKEAMDELWLAVESYPGRATIFLGGRPFSLASSFDEIRATPGLEELLKFLKTRK